MFSRAIAHCFARSSRCLILPLMATCASLWPASAGHAAPAKAAAAGTEKAPALMFDMTARFTSLENGRPGDLPTQIIDARVYLRGTQARVETELSDRRVVFLLTPPRLTKLLPEARAGVQWRIGNTSSALPGNGSMSVQNLIRDPAAVRAAIIRSGAKRTGSTKLNGVAVDVYSASKFMGKPQKVTAWLRKNDSLPVRVQIASPSLSSVLSWRNYKRLATVPSALFRVPAGYQIRQATGTPSLM